MKNEYSDTRWKVLAKWTMRKIIILFLSTTGILFLINMYQNYIWSESSKRTLQTIEFNNTKLKYILLWTNPNTIPFNLISNGQEIFVKKRCSETNCFITPRLPRRFFGDSLLKFDAILFHGPDLSTTIYMFPTKRAPHQKYVFISSESSSYYPLHHPRYDGFFNWTWTYKLNSDIYYGYIIIRNKQGDIIGPKNVMHWLEFGKMRPIEETLKEKLNGKSKAAAWFVSNCIAANRRLLLGLFLRKELAKYNMTVDIYGLCGPDRCPRENMTECLHKVERDYYFYLAFENSFSEDYVTEKLLHALQHYAVPIVYGDANYSRFLPDGSYLNARTLGRTKLIEQIIDAIYNKEKYYDFFRWTNHYSYHGLEETPETNSFCKFCSMLNDANVMKQKTINRDFRNWWN